MNSEARKMILVMEEETVEQGNKLWKLQRKECRIFLNRGIRTGLRKEVIFEERLEGSEGIRQVGIWEKSIVSKIRNGHCWHSQTRARDSGSRMY